VIKNSNGGKGIGKTPPTACGSHLVYCPQGVKWFKNVLNDVDVADRSHLGYKNRRGARVVTSLNKVSPDSC